MKDLYKSREDDTLAVFKCLSFSPDDKFLATGESLGDVKVSVSKVVYVLDLIAPGMDSLPEAS